VGRWRVVSGDTDGSAGLHARVLDALGLAIVEGELAAGAVLTVEELEVRYGASRSVVREAVRVLRSVGLVTSRRHLGVRVLDPSEWNLYSPLVIRWRLDSGARIEQLRALMELRVAVEPEAARLAAERGTDVGASDLAELAGRLSAAAAANDADAFLRHDIEFHGLILSLSGNPMFGQLQTLVGETLVGRTALGLVPEHPHADALQAHHDVAATIRLRDGDAAHDIMRAIMLRTVRELNERAAPTDS
jgi:DNA-binding FadR family transcriptional regulator